jgi:hypothetical protein
LFTVWLSGEDFKENCLKKDNDHQTTLAKGGNPKVESLP